MFAAIWHCAGFGSSTQDTGTLGLPRARGCGRGCGRGGAWWPLTPQHGALGNKGAARSLPSRNQETTARPELCRPEEQLLPPPCSAPPQQRGFRHEGGTVEPARGLAQQLGGDCSLPTRECRRARPRKGPAPPRPAPPRSLLHATALGRPPRGACAGSAAITPCGERPPFSASGALRAGGA